MRLYTNKRKIVLLQSMKIVINLYIPCTIDTVCKFNNIHKYMFFSYRSLVFWNVKYEMLRKKQQKLFTGILVPRGG